MPNRRTLSEAFNAVFHDKGNFRDFCSFNLEDEIEELRLTNRKIIRTSPKLKGYLRFIDRVILRNLQNDPEVVHSFLKNKSTLTAVKAHACNRYFFITDIKNFFPSVKTENVRHILQRDRDLVPIEDFESHIDLIVSMTTLNDSIPIGFPTSPQLSNAYLFDFDQETKRFCEKRSLTYTRYADDIIISGQNFDELAELKNEIQTLLENCTSEKMVLNKAKTHITQIGNKVKILGLVITPSGIVTIDKKYKMKIETSLHLFTTDKKKFDDFVNKTMDGKERSLFGLLHYARSIDPSYIEKLQRKYGAYTVRSLMEDRWSDN